MPQGDCLHIQEAFQAPPRQHPWGVCVGGLLWCDPWQSRFHPYYCLVTMVTASPS